MNLYLNLINDAIEYIEANINTRINPALVSAQFHLSEYHFERLFKSTTKQSLKQYILGRKLTAALGRLRLTDDSIISISLDLGFEYPEVFSRAFKKQFGISPLIYRKELPEISPVERALAIPRDLVSFPGGLIPKADFSYFESLVLEGVLINAAMHESASITQIREASMDFLAHSDNNPGLSHDKFYSIIDSLSNKDGKYKIKIGKESLSSGCKTGFRKFILPEGWYAVFSYNGEMLEICSTFLDDLFKWIAVKDIELSSNGVGLISIYDKDYFTTQNIRILVPVKGPQK